MILKSQVIQALEAKRDQFKTFEGTLTDDLTNLNQALEAMANSSLDQIEFWLASVPFPGARPSSEFSSSSNLVVPFAQVWGHHEAARAWACETLMNRPTFAVDGSQVPPSKDFSIPIAAVQIGWFENPHARETTYEKSIQLDILSPDELLQDDGEERDGFPDERVNMRRFEAEVAKLIERMNASSNGCIKPLCFFDGSLVVSFAQHLRPSYRQRYINAIVKLLDVSEATRTPLIGYVDTSYASDLIAMLSVLQGWTTRPRLSDGALLRPCLSWGERCQAFICARDDTVLMDYGKHQERVCFTYLKTTADGSPVRLDFPQWMLEDGILEQSLDVVRAECIIGTGYPYAVETADAVAVITAEDREYFYRLFQEFTEREQLALRYSRKALSKRRRR